MSLGLQLLAATLADEEARIRLFQTREELFKPEEAEVLGYIRHHVGLTGKYPKVETIQAETGVTLPEAPEPAKYYLDKLRTRYKHTTIRKTLLEAEELLGEKNTDEALSLLMQRAVQVMTTVDSQKIFDFHTSGVQHVLNEYKAKLILGDAYNIRLGWDTPDRMIGGAAPGDVIAIVGRPARGKTYMLLHAVDNAWWYQKKNVLVVSMEMKPLPILQRLAALHFHYPITDLKKSQFSTKVLKKFKQDALSIKNNDKHLWVIDGNMTSSVAEIMAYAHMLNVDAVYIDGAYLVRGSNTRAARWERITEVTEAIKSQIAQELGIVAVGSWQLNRDSEKKVKKDKDDAGTEDIAGADAVGQVASLVIALLDDPTIENVKTRMARIIKGREGEQGQFMIRWMFDEQPYSSSMNFSEITKKEKEEMEKAELGFV